MKNALTEVIRNARKRNEEKKIGKIETSNPCKETVLVCNLDDDTNNKDVLSYSFNCIIVVEDNRLKGMNLVDENRSQPEVVTRNKREVLRPFTFKIGLVTKERDPIHIINSGIEAPLLGPG